VTSVKVTDDGIDADDRLAFQRENRAKHTMGRRVLRPHVHRQALAASVVELDACECRG
jgi:hypothetical protein